MQVPGRRKMDKILSAFREIRQNRHLDLLEFAQCILQQIKPVCEPSGCAVMLIEGGRAKMIAHEGMSGHACGVEIRVDTAALGALRNHHEGLQANHIDDSPLSGIIPAGREAKSALCMPVIQGDIVAGLIYLDSQHGEAFDWEDLCCVDLMAEELSLSLQRSLIEAQVNRMSEMDVVVGCLNRSALEEDLKNEIARSKRYEKQFSLFLLEIDHITAAEGAQNPEEIELLRSYLAGIFRRNIRNIDRIYFYGQQRFAVLLPETDKIETISVASRLIDMVRRRRMQDRDGVLTNRTATVSIGISGYPHDGNSNGELLDAAQTALDRAKYEGGNRLSVCGESRAPTHTLTEK
jgi:diguanylate cyclase (GGDEF)-like protein